MSFGTISTKILVDIGNAIRMQSGSSLRFKPAELASAVDVLDGSKTGEALAVEYPEIASGIVSMDVFADLADAIRSKNGLTERYRPDAMAAAILSLTFSAVDEPRAILFEDGLFWMGYLSSVPLGHGKRDGVWEISATGYNALKDRPWYASRLRVGRAQIDTSLAAADISSCRYWFEGMSGLEEVRGFENLSGVADFSYTFSGCGSLRSIFAESFDNSAISNVMGAFSSCARLVGESFYCPGSSEKKTAFGFDEKGVLCHEGERDKRFWVWSALFDDDSVEIGPDLPDDGRKVVESCPICAQARYKAIRCTAWGSSSSDVKTARMRSMEMPDDLIWNMNYWFYGCKYMEAVEGLGNLRRVGEMTYAFNQCWQLPNLDLRGIDPSGLRDLSVAFGDCSQLSVITVDADWKLPAGVNWSSSAGYQTFKGCRSLKGGVGTIFDAKKVAGAMAIVDTYDTPGYLTAG